MQISLKKILNKIFPPASVVVIKGDWKTGKTDFALKLVEWLFQYKMIRKFASNIWIEPGQIKKHNIPFKFLTNVPAIKKWGIPPTGDNKSKVFIYDEAVSSSPSRRAMSKLNTAWLKLIPELSKGRLKLIVCVHTTKYLDSVFLNKIYLRGLFHKSARKNGEVITESFAKLLYPNFRDQKTNISLDTVLKCPRTFFKFDPYRTAIMSTDIDETLDFDRRYKILVDYVYKGKSFSQMARERKVFPMEIRRDFQKALKILIEDKLKVPPAIA